jgi:hypothetical protein
MVARAASQRHVGRDEMCKYLMTYIAAEARWVEFTAAGVRSCGIPIQIADQLKQALTNTELARDENLYGIARDSAATRGRFRLSSTGCQHP